MRREALGAYDLAVVLKFVRGDFRGLHGTRVGARNDQRGARAGFVGALQHLFEFVFAGVGERAIGVAAARCAILGDSVAKQVKLQSYSTPLFGLLMVTAGILASFTILLNAAMSSVSSF